MRLTPATEVQWLSAVKNTLAMYSIQLSLVAREPTVVH